MASRRHVTLFIGATLALTASGAEWRQEGDKFYEGDKIWSRPKDWRQKNCGADAGVDCRPWACVEKALGAGYCTNDENGWKWRPKTEASDQSDGGADPGVNTTASDAQKQADKDGYTQDGDTFTDASGAIWSRPKDWRQKNCGADAGAGCKPWACVEKKLGKGKCTNDDNGWHWKSVE